MLDFLSPFLPDGWVTLFHEDPELFEGFLGFIGVSIVLIIVLAKGNFGWNGGGDSGFDGGGGE